MKHFYKLVGEFKDTYTSGKPKENTSKIDYLGNCVRKKIE